MVKLFAITVNAFQETLRRRVFYVVLLLTLLIVAGISSEMYFLRMARKAGETQVLMRMGTHLMQGVLQTWNVAAVFLAIFLGAIGVSAEISAKTIVHVMSRPVERSVYLLGRWFGLLMFLWLFLLLGVCGALLIAAWLHVPFAPTLWMGFAQMYVSAMFYSGVALSLSIVLPPVAAGAVAFLFSILPDMLEDAIRDPRWLHRLPALIGYYLGPAKMPVDLIAESFSKERVDTDYWLYASVLGENLLYVFAALILANLVFRRRELRVR